ncbi:hypothetical protein M3Y98_01114300 [Aphelenchoides besseyi]|nr:hypothetical protein M3Y98_01114300 [Aphelenchoides besseyi]KAI6209187.1 hypothetical protein M3Y96_00194900 [Aphelenchoides besseyi]
MPKMPSNKPESTTDAENPPINTLTSPGKSSDNFTFLPEIDPAFGTVCISTFCNFALSHMFLYGITGNARMAFLAGTFTIPASVISVVIDAKKDFENWTRTKRLREKGLAEKFMPYKVKYDWSKHEKNMAPRFFVSESTPPTKPT